MASMEDLIATMSGGLHAGQQGNDLKDLHAKLTQTIQSSPHYRPIPPSSSSSAAIGTHTTAGPLPPPAPASSWNTPVAHGLQANFGGFAAGSPSSFGKGQASGTSPMRQAGWPGSSQNYNQGQGQGQAYGQAGKNIGSGGGGSGGSGTGVPGPKAYNGRTNGAFMMETEEDRPYHAAVLPVQASPKETGGFDQDAFRPLWDGRSQGGRGGAPAGGQGQGYGGGGGGRRDWGGFQGEKL